MPRGVKYFLNILLADSLCELLTIPKGNKISFECPNKDILMMTDVEI